MVKRSYDAMVETDVVKRTKAGRPRLTPGQLALKKVRKLENSIESKVFDTNPSSFVVNATSPNGVMWGLCGVQQGDDANDRIGDKITPTKLHIRYRAQETAVSGSVCTLLRVIVLQCKQRFIPVFDGSQPNGVLNNTLTVDDKPLADYLEENRGHFNVLYDKVETLVTPSNTETIAREITVYPKMAIKYETGSYVTFEAGQIYIGFVSNTNSGSLGCGFYARLWYRDL